MGTWAKEFRQFVLRGNVVSLAVAVVIGVAFNAVISALVRDLITPLIAAIVGEPNFDALQFTINDAAFLYGDFLNFLLNFIIIALVVFFLVVKPVNALQARSRRREQPPDPTSKKCPECRSEIPVDARRCAFCTVELAAAEGAATT